VGCAGEADNKTSPLDLALLLSSYVIVVPRNDRESAAFQHLINKRMIFPAPETGPERCREPHFRFQSGEPRLDSDRADRQQDRSPVEQEAAQKKHRNLR
jgi:hypothetical protein